MKPLLMFLLAAIASAQEVNPDKRLEHATEAMRVFLSPDSNIPKSLIGKAQCVVVVPRLMKGAFLFGGKYGRGFAACRKTATTWSSPAAIAIEGGSFGPQLGESATDLIMLVMNQRGMTRLLGDKFTLGGEAAIVAGPTGVTASANTDVLMMAEMISYSRARGLFVGLSLEGATLRPDGGENKKLYGHEVGNRDILMGKVPPPKGARAFLALLNKRARKGK
jgi:lipid-binding SYLF domain-containing protein